MRRCETSSLCYRVKNSCVSSGAFQGTSGLLVSEIDCGIVTGHNDLRVSLISLVVALANRSFSSITVFLVLLSGWTLGPDVGGISTLDAIASTGKLETIIFTSAIICGILHCGLVLRTAIKLG